MKITVLCNGNLALPALMPLIQDKKVTAIGIGDNNAETIHVYTALAKQHALPLKVFNKITFAADLAAWLDAHQPDVVLVKTFPFVIPEGVLGVPKFGFINFHYGLLPEMRGADPIFETLRQKREKGGITVHVVEKGLDTGAIIYREEVACPVGYTYGLLSRDLAHAGDHLTRQLVKNLEAGAFPETKPQDESKAEYFPKIGAEQLRINWTEMTAADILSLIGSVNPILKTGIVVKLNGWNFGVLHASTINLNGDLSPYAVGTILVIDPQNGLIALTMDGVGLKFDVVYTEEGYFPGHNLANFGIAPGMKFENA